MRSLARFATSLPFAAKGATAALCLVAVAAPGQEEVPFVTTRDAVTLAMLELARVSARDHRRPRLRRRTHRHHGGAPFGASGLGVEIVPDWLT